MALGVIIHFLALLFSASKKIRLASKRERENDHLPILGGAFTQRKKEEEKEEGERMGAAYGRKRERDERTHGRGWLHRPNQQK